jgi:hypothetical protein
LPFREPALPLRDIIDGIAMIEEFTRGMDFESFQEDAKTVAAAEWSGKHSAGSYQRQHRSRHAPLMPT